MIILSQLQETPLPQTTNRFRTMQTIKNTFSKIESMLTVATVRSIAATAYFAFSNFIA